METSNTQGIDPTVEVLGDTVGPMPCYIAFTLSADPMRKFGKRCFDELSPTEQKCIYYCCLKDVYKKYKERYGFKIMYVHYELDKSLKLHCHGYVDCKECIVGFDVPKLELMSYIHKTIGRLGNRKNVACLIKWIDGVRNTIEEWKKYCEKENALKFSKIKGSSILDFID